MHHRTKEFEREFREALENLKSLTDCDDTPILLAASGTGAMEASLLNTLSAGDKIIVLNAGAFGERWTLIAKRLQLDVVEIKAELGHSPTTVELEAVLRVNRDAKAFALQCTETSTTVNHPFAQIANLVKAEIPAALVILDAVSAVATVDISIKRHNVDIIVAGSQKGFMLPPGLSMIMLSKRAWNAVDAHQSPSFYFDLKVERVAQLKSTSAWTPAMSLILGLNESFRMLREEGLENVYMRHARMAAGCRAGLSALGFTLLAPKHPATGVTGAYPPVGVDSEQLRTQLLNKHGVKITGGQLSLQGKIIRIGHMGYVGEFDIITALSAVELALPVVGGKKMAGAGVSAAMEIFA